MVTKKWHLLFGMLLFFILFSTSALGSLTLITPVDKSGIYAPSLPHNISVGYTGDAESNCVLYTNEKVITPNVTNVCYQETATTATSCGGLSTGAYAHTTTNTSYSTRAYDEIWTTRAYSTGGNLVRIWMNYTIPNNTVSAMVEYKMGGSSPYITQANITIPSNSTADCFNTSYGKIRLQVNLSTTKNNAYLYCLAAKDNHLVLLASRAAGGTSVSFYEEGIYWTSTPRSNTTALPLCENTTVLIDSYGSSFINISDDTNSDRSNFVTYPSAGIYFDISSPVNNSYAINPELPYNMTINFTTYAAGVTTDKCWIEYETNKTDVPDCSSIVIQLGTFGSKIINISANDTTGTIYKSGLGFTIYQAPIITLDTLFNMKGFGILSLPYTMQINYTVMGLLDKCWMAYTTTQGTRYCYQETATIATDCGGLSSGSYTPSGIWSGSFPSSRTYDGDWNTYGHRSSTTTDIDVYYNIPKGANSAKVMYKLDDAVVYNDTLPLACFENQTQVHLQLESNDAPFSRIQCYPGPVIIKTINGGSDIYEEAMWWIFNENSTETLDNCSNATLIFQNYSYGTIAVYANDTLNNIGSASANFSVKAMASNASVDPHISYSPINYGIAYDFDGATATCSMAIPSSDITCGTTTGSTPLNVVCTLQSYQFADNLSIYPVCNGTDGYYYSGPANNVLFDTSIPSINMISPLDGVGYISTTLPASLNLTYIVSDISPAGIDKCWYSIDSPGACYQETANISTSCGGLSSGKYNCTGNFTNSCSNGYDGDWTTYAGPPPVGQVSYVYINYTKPTNALSSSKWQINGQPSTGTSSYRNLTIPTACWNQAPLRFRVNLTQVNPSNYESWFFCYNGSNWINFTHDSNDYYLSEEAMWWDLSITPIANCSNTTVNITTYDSHNITLFVNDTTGNIASYTANIGLANLTTNLSSYRAINKQIPISLYINSGGYANLCSIVLNDTVLVCSSFAGTGNGTLLCIPDSGVEVPMVGYTQCIDTNGFTFSANPVLLFVDTVNPVFTYSNFSQMNSMASGRGNITGQFIIEDSNLYEINVTINGTQIFGVTNLNTTFYQYNMSINLNNSFKPGVNTLMVQVWDSHTKKNIKDYGIVALPFTNTISYNTGSNKVRITAVDEPFRVTNPFYTQKETDRYTFEYTPDAKNKNKYDFEVNADNPITIIDKPNTELKLWLVSGRNWIDFDTGGASDVTITRVDDYTVRISVKEKGGKKLLANGKKVKFRSIGDLNQVNESYEFYIGGSINITNINDVDNTTYLNNVTVTVIKISGDSYVGEFSGSISFPEGYSEIVENLTVGTYTFNISSVKAFDRSYNVTVSNVTQNMNYTSHQAEINFLMRNVQNGVILSGGNFTVSKGGFKRTVTNASPISNIMYLNATTYLVNATQGVGFLPYLNNLTFTYKENDTVYINMPISLGYTLYDEKTLSLFNMSSPTSMYLQINCQDLVQRITLKNSTYNIGNTFNMSITCQFASYSFWLYFDDLLPPQNYFRSFIYLPGQSLSTQNIYLFDVRTTNYVQNSFIVDDLLSEYQNPSIFVYKWVNNNLTLITSDYTDIEQKISAYLVQNNEYIIELHSDNNPVFSMGNYFSVASGEKVLRLYQVSLGPVPAHGETFTGGGLVTENYTIAYFRYNTTDLPVVTNVQIIANRSGATDGVILANYTTSNTDYLYTFDISGMNSSDIVVLVTITHSQPYTVAYVAHVADARVPQVSIWQYMNWTTETVGGVQRIVLGNALQWAILLLLAFLALAGTIDTQNIVGLVFVLLGLFFAFMKIFPVALPIMGLALLIVIIGTLREGSKR